MTEREGSPETEHDPRAVVDDLERLGRELPDVDVEADVWWKPTQGRDGHLHEGEFSYISVEIVPASSSEILNYILNKHELVIRSFSCGTDGFRAQLDYEGRVHS